MSMTLKDIRDQVKEDLDLEEEDFITDADIDRWIRQGVKKAESIIHDLYEDYFLVEADPLTITSGTFLYDYPTDVYANKIRRIVYSDSLTSNNQMHTVKRVKDLAEAKSMDLLSSDTVNPILSWSPSNKAGEGRKIRLWPNVGRSGFLYIFYIRNAKELVLDADVCDIDEYEEYVVQYAKTQAYLKDGDPRAEDSRILEKEYENMMILSLSEMAPDRDTHLEMDVSHYDDSVGGDW